MVTLFDDALAGVSEANRASGATVTPRTIAATTEPIRRLGFRNTRTFAALMK